MSVNLRFWSITVLDNRLIVIDKIQNVYDAVTAYRAGGGGRKSVLIILGVFSALT